MADVIYNAGKAALLGDTSYSAIDPLADTIKVALLNNSHAADADTQHTWSDVSANEVSGTGYTAGGQALGTKTSSIDDVDNEGAFDSADVTWTITGSLSAYYAVIYKDTGTPATSTLIASLDFGGVQTATDGDFTISWNAEGVLNLG